MVLKLLVVVLAFLVLDTSTQMLSPFQIDLYKYGFIKDQDKRQHDWLKWGSTSSPCKASKTCTPMEPSRPTRPSNTLDNMKRAWNQEKLDLINLLRSLPREEISEPVIFVSDEYENLPEK